MGVDFQVSNDPCHSLCSVSPAYGLRYELSDVLVIISLLCFHGDEFPGTVCPIKCFLLKVDLVVVFDHSNRNVNKTLHVGSGSTNPGYLSVGTQVT